MARIETTQRTLYRFSELSDDAKETAREWYRGTLCGDDLSDDRDDWKAVATILGIEFATRQVRLMSGASRSEPKIWWSGFWPQGDGASWEGWYSYAKGASKRIREYAPTDKMLHAIADTLAGVQRRNFYQLQATVTQSGHYSHSGCMRFDVSRMDDKDVSESDCDTLETALRDFADWIYSQLETEWEYLNSDSTIDDAMTANEFEFDESGNIA